MPSVRIPGRDLVNAMRASRSWMRLIHDSIIYSNTVIPTNKSFHLFIRNPSKATSGD